MLLTLTVAFIVVYLGIALEHPIRIDKAASALFGAGLLWTIYAVAANDHESIVHQLRETIGSTAGIIFFLMGAMTIVEVIDAHDGLRDYHLTDQDEEVDHVDVADLRCDVLLECSIGQSDHHHRHGFTHPEATGPKK